MSPLAVSAADAGLDAASAARTIAQDIEKWLRLSWARHVDRELARARVRGALANSRPLQAGYRKQRARYAMSADGTKRTWRKSS